MSWASRRSARCSARAVLPEAVGPMTAISRGSAGFLILDFRSLILDFGFWNCQLQITNRQSPISVLHQGSDRVAKQVLAPFEEAEFDQKAESAHLAFQPFDQPNCGGGRA